MVEWKLLGEVCEILDSQRRPVSKGERNQGVYPYYGANGIQDYVDSYIFDGTFLLLGEDGSVINKDKSPVLNWAEGKIWVNNHAHILKENKKALLRYLYYSLQCIDVSDIVRGVPPKINQANMRTIPLPIPSLSEQNRIVGILDTFTSCIENLKKQISERRKQYEYYRDQLLDLEGKEGVEIKIVNEVFDTRNGYTPSTNNPEFWDNGTLPWFKMEDIRDNGRILNDSILHITPKAIKGKGLFKANSIILATSATIGEHALITVDHLSNQRFTNFYPNKKMEDRINMKYVYYYMFKIDEWCKQHVNQGGFASVDMSGLYGLSFPIPTLEEQSRIVSILDTFEESIQNLEAQLKLREKQYEYYRNKLLTFE